MTDLQTLSRLDRNETYNKTYERWTRDKFSPIMGATLSVQPVFTGTVLVAAVAFGYHHYLNNLSNGNAGSERLNKSEENKFGSLASPVHSTSGVRSTMPGQFHQTPNDSKLKKSKKKKKSQCSTTELDTTLQPSTNSPPTSTRYSHPVQPPTIVSVDANSSRTRVNSIRKNGQSTEDIATTPDVGIMPPVAEGLPLDEESVTERATVAKCPSSQVPKTNVDELSRLGACLY